MPTLAIAGGTPVRTDPYPEWPHGDDADVAAVEVVVRGGYWGGFPEPGPRAAAFEERFAAYQGARHGVLMANGTVTMEEVTRTFDAYQEAFERMIGVPPGTLHFHDESTLEFWFG